MGAAIVALIGATIGAMAGIAGGYITQLMQAKVERENWIRSKREETYANTLRSLLRVGNRRSAVSKGTAYVSQDFIKEWFDDLVEAQFWASSLTIYCSKSQKAKVTKVLRELNDVATDYEHSLGGAETAGRLELSLVLEWYATIMDCASEDIGMQYDVVSERPER